MWRVACGFDVRDTPGWKEGDDWPLVVASSFVESRGKAIEENKDNEGAMTDRANESPNELFSPRSEHFQSLPTTRFNSAAYQRIVSHSTTGTQRGSCFSCLSSGYVLAIMFRLSRKLRNRLNRLRVRDTYRSRMLFALWV